MLVLIISHWVDTGRTRKLVYLLFQTRISSYKVTKTLHLRENTLFKCKIFQNIKSYYEGDAGGSDLQCNYFYISQGKYLGLAFSDRTISFLSYYLSSFDDTRIYFCEQKLVTF